jgi:hypothetical protein
MGHRAMTNGVIGTVTIPRWLIMVVSLVCALLGAGAAVGIGWTTRERDYDGRIAAVERAVVSLSERVDRNYLRVDSLVAFRARDTRILDALGRLRCLDGTPRNLTEAADLPCATLLRTVPR